MKNLESIKLTKANGEVLKLDQFKNKALLFVNTASKCGYTPQYQELQKLYEKYQDGLEIIAIPCNQFGEQEPGSEEQILSFCELNFGVTFPILKKGEVNGPNRHPLFQHLIEASQSKDDIKWNFEKFLVSKDRSQVFRFKSAISPLNSELEENIKKQTTQN